MATMHFAPAPRVIDLVELNGLVTTTDDSHNLVSVWPENGMFTLWSNESAEYIGIAADPENARQMLNG